MKYRTLLIFPCLFWIMLQSCTGQGTGRRYPSEMKVIRDSVTGLPITVLTTDPANDSKIYQTHPQWTSDGNYIVFRSNRGGGRRSHAFAVNVRNGDIVQLTDDPDLNTGSLNISRKRMELYFTKGGRGVPVRLFVLDMGRLLEDSRSGKVPGEGEYEKLLATLPDGLGESGGFCIDVNEDKAYMGVSRGEELGGIRWIDLKSGETGTVIDVDFRMGHVQASPFIPGEIVYCHETGGDAPQRMWMVNADGSGNRPLYVENDDEWVTHEVITTPDLVYFDVMGHLPRLRKKPTGIFSINLRNDEVRALGQISPGRGFWHCNGSADGKWAAGDDFEGNIHLINLETSEISLLTTGHLMRPDHAHPTFSPDGRQILFQSGMLSGGESLDLMLMDVPNQ